MAISSKNPLYAEFIEDWQTMRDTYRGERVVKDKGQTYLPPTSGMVVDGYGSLGSPGQAAYNAYIRRAVFPDLVADAVEAMIGIMHRKPPVINVPAAMEPMLERATPHGEGIHQLLRRINEQQLVTGRIGLFLDLPEGETLDQVLPYIATYTAETIINWDEGQVDDGRLPQLNMVVLNETENVRQGDFEWKEVEKYRVMLLGGLAADQDGQYRVGVFQGDTFNEAEMIEPSLRGNTLEQIPFVFINSKDIVPSPDDPPLLGLAKLCLAIYRGEADYRQNLFMQAQDTLVVIGSNEEEHRVGAGATIVLPQGGDAKYIGVRADGLSEQREALQNDRRAAASKAGQLVDAVSRERESGEALKIRVAAQTATLNQIALSGAAGLQHILRLAATWMGLDPEQVTVEPNLDFVEDEMAGREIVELMTAKAMGAPLSLQTIHKRLRDKDVTELSYEDEMELIEEEDPIVGTDAGGDPGDDPDEETPPEDDPEE